ncbi:hypothetical protein F4808DRAFT_459181 [Astrocystis sublimbata]|nr:hypothetical protein F4808DRAFT_459181 [Astrocystis sublimbata]
MPRSTHSSNSSSDGLSASTRPVSESAVPELDADLSTTDDVTSDYLSSRTRSVLGPLVDNDDGYGSNAFDTTSIYSPSHFPAISIPHGSIGASWDEAETIDSTRSITDLDVDYVVENGRRYCGPYYMPIDEDEQVRLQLLNQVYLKVLDGELTTVPLESPTFVIDIGTGVGDWAIDMAELYPECEITGTDISNIFERRVPQNVYWEVDDAELEWERPPDHYDLVHLRDMAGAFQDWEAIYMSAFRCLKPGGWIELIDYDDKKGLHDLFAYFEPESTLYKLAQDLQDASVLSGRPRGISHLEPRLLVNAGYVDVNITEYSIPLKTQDGSTGKFWLLSCLNGMEPACMRLLTKYKGWKPEEVRMACELINEELMALAHDSRRAKTFVVKLRVLTGRKPGHHTRWLSTPAGEVEGFEDGSQTNSERLCGSPDLRSVSNGPRYPGFPTVDTDQSRLYVPVTRDSAPWSNNLGGDILVPTANTSDPTEDWLRNVDVGLPSNETEHVACADETMTAEHDKENREGSQMTEESHPDTCPSPPKDIDSQNPDIYGRHSIQSRSSAGQYSEESLNI